MMEFLIPGIFGLIGFEFALKLNLIFQAIIFIALLVWLIKSTEGMELDGMVPIFFFVVFMIGMIIGDVYYYSNYYHGSIDFGWLFRP